MAEKENGEDPQVNLELPSIGFGSRRKRRKGEVAAEGSAEGASASDAAPTEVVDEPEASAPAGEETQSLYVDDAPTAPPATEDPSLRPADVPTPVATEPGRRAEKQARPAKASKPAKPVRDDRPPVITGMPAALVTGAVVGLLTVGLTVLGLRGCEAVNDTNSCGGAGFFIWVAILVGMVMLGSWMLGSFRVVDPGSTSFLAVGLAVVIVLLFLIDVVFDWWMVIAVPLIFVATYALAHWVTVRFIEPADHG